jgi:hypothetical protein
MYVVDAAGALAQATASEARWCAARARAGEMRGLRAQSPAKISRLEQKKREFRHFGPVSAFPRHELTRAINALVANSRRHSSRNRELICS